MLNTSLGPTFEHQHMAKNVSPSFPMWPGHQCKDQAAPSDMAQWGPGSTIQWSAFNHNVAFHGFIPPPTVVQKSNMENSRKKQFIKFTSHAALISLMKSCTIWLYPPWAVNRLCPSHVCYISSPLIAHRSVVVLAVRVTIAAPQCLSSSLVLLNNCPKGQKQCCKGGIQT